MTIPFSQSTKEEDSCLYGIDNLPQSSQSMPNNLTNSSFGYRSSVLVRDSRLKQFESIRSQNDEEDYLTPPYTPSFPARAYSYGQHYEEQSFPSPKSQLASPCFSATGIDYMNQLNHSSLKGSFSQASHDGSTKPIIEEKSNLATPSPTIPTKAEKKPFREGETSYLDGILGMALIMIFIQNFANLTWLNSHPEMLKTGTESQVLRSPMGLVLFFLVIARKSVTEFFRQKASLEPIQWNQLPIQMMQRTIGLGILASICLFVQKIECASDSFKNLLHAETILGANGMLEYPAWCPINPTTNKPFTSILDILTSLVRLFTNFNFQQQLNNTGMLWTIPVQIWGTLYVMMCLPIILSLSNARRFGLYAMLIGFLGLTYSPYLTFFVAMITCDLRTSGLIKKLQNRSRITFISVELVLATVSVLFLVHMKFEQTIVKFFSKSTFNDGSFGINLDQNDFGREPVILLRSFVLFLWIEMSVTFQWIIGNFAFKAIGRVGMAFYLSQLSLFYLLIPALTTRYHGNLYWDGVVDMFVACFILNYVFGWIITHTVQKAGDLFAQWLVNTMMEKGFISLLFQAVQNTINAIRYLPTIFSKNIPNATSSKIESCKQAFHSIKHWRTPSPIVPPPSHPMQYGLREEDLHSTLFDADISNSPQAVRTRKLLRFWSFMSPLNAIMIPGIAVTWGMCNPWHKFTTNEFVTISTLWRIMWMFAVPYCVITCLGYITPDITKTPEQQINRPVKRELIRNFYILSVTRGSNPEATRRAHTKLKELEQYHPAVRVCVLTDEPNVYPDLDNIVCPKSYKSPKGLAKHKARALDYFRHTMQLGPYDFVLHMDEESTMDAESLRGCFDFIRYQTHHIGQGIIIYNGHNYWANWRAWLFAIADTIRVGDDLARFSLQTNVIHRPVFGIHGSFLLLNGEAENVVGWDFASLAEDFEFSQSAWMKGFTLGRIHGIVREQSPENFTDFMKQRRRWYMGIRQIKGVYHLPQLAIKLWTAGIFCLVATVVNTIFSFLFPESGASPLWIYVLSTFCLGSFEWLYLGGLLFQEIDYGYKYSQMWQIPIHVVALVILQPVMATVEGFSIIWAMSTEDGEVGFQVVKK